MSVDTTPPTTSVRGTASPEQLVADLETEVSGLWQLRRARARELAGLLHPRLEPTSLPLIGALGASGASRPSDLGRRLHVDPSTLSRQISAAERLGLVTRVPDPTDARARLVDLSPTAREQYRAYRQEQLDHWQRVISAWPDGDVQTLTALLRRLREDW